MDSQESPPVHHPPQPPTHLQSSPHHHHHYQQPPHGTMVAPPPPPQPQPHQSQPHHQPQQPNSYTVPNNNNLNIPTHNNNNIQQQQNPQFGFNSGPKPNLDFTDGSSSAGAVGGPIGGGPNLEPAAKKKRGRPRKYSPDGNIALGLSPNPPVTPISSTVAVGGAPGAGAGNGAAASSENPSKKARGRPPGSSNKKQEALGAVGVGFGFTPHLITVSAGEDIASKVMTFSQQGPRAVCILSANGAVSNVTLRQSAMSGGTVTYEGRFEIISLSGSFLLSESNGSRSRTGGLSVSLSGPDGRVLGGGVAGMLMAATPVQVVVGSFIADGKKPKSQAPPVAPTSNMLNFGAPPVAEASSPSQGASSDSSDENGGSPLSHGPGPFGNTTQPMHGMPMYWSGQTM